MRTAIKKIAILLLLSCLFSAIPFVKADLIQYGVPFAIRPYIVFPSNLTYTSGVLTLNVSFHAEIWDNFNYSMTYSLDGQEKVPLHVEQHYAGIFNQDESYVDGSATLPTYSEGSHSIKVYLTCVDVIIGKAGKYTHTYLDQQTVYFSTTGAVPTPTPSPTPSPASSTQPQTEEPAQSTRPLSQGAPYVSDLALVLTSVVVIAVILTVILVFSRSKRKQVFGLV